jgi:membrane protein YqaA with SNARE-associated domain
MSITKDIEVGVESAFKIKSVEQATRLMRGRSGLAMVSGISLIESALPAPLITDPFLIAAILVDRANALRLVVLTTLTSVIGGLVAYYSAIYFLELLMQYMTPAMLQEFESIADAGGGNTFVITLLGAVTPIPYTIVAWVVAALKGNVLLFAAASALGRGFRYAVVGYCAYQFGSQAVEYVRRYTGIASLLLVVLVGLFLWYKM